MVKNLPTIERSTKIRFGKHATDDQAENTIVLNASSTAINAPTSDSIYMSPLRVTNPASTTVIGYNPTTKELYNTNVLTSAIGGGGGNITLGTDTAGDYVSTITGGNGITSTGATSGETIAHTLSIDTKTNGGLVIESNKLAVDLGASSITGTLAIGDGGTGATTLTSGKIPYIKADNTFGDSKISYNNATEVTSLSSNLTVTGNLLVQGSATFQHSEIHSVSDPIIEVGNANAIDTIDMGIIMTRPTANVVAGYRGDESEYTIAYTLSDPSSTDIVPTNASTDGYITANIWGNVLCGNVTTSGSLTSTAVNVDGITTSNVVLAGGYVNESTAQYFTVTAVPGIFIIDGVNQPVLTLYRGVTYRFDYSDSSNASHPLRISTTAEGEQYNPGYSSFGTRGNAGAYIQFIVPMEAPDTMYYNCQTHAGMGNTINVISPSLTSSVSPVSSNVFIGNHIGIGTSSPSYPLDVTGNMNVTGGLRANGSSGTNGQVLTSSGGGVMSWGSVGTAQGGTGVTTGLAQLDADNITSGTLAVGNGGTGATTLDNLITLGSHTTGNYVQSITAGNGITAGAASIGGTPTVAIDAKTDGGLVIESNKLAVDLGASSITGTLAVGNGGTGATTLDNLITLGSHTTGNYVQSITAGNGITAGAASIGGTPTVAIDAKTDGGLVIESNKLAVDLGASSITGTLAVGNGGSPWTTSGTQVYYTGNVGIGSENPGGYKLYVSGTGRFLGTVTASSFSGSGSGLTGLSASQISSGTLAVARGGSPWTTSGANIYYNTGNVGIGTTNPGYKLDVKVSSASSASNPIANFTASTSSTGYDAYTKIEGWETSALNFYCHNFGDAFTIGYKQDFTYNGFIIAQGNTLTGTPLFFVDYGGNVGIGTTNPGYKLDVSGSVRGTSFAGSGSGLTGLSASQISSGTLAVARGGTNISSYGSGEILYSSGGSLTKLNIGSSGDVLTVAGGNPTWATASGGGFSGDIADYITHTGDANTKFGFPSSDTFTITTDNTERFRINSGGEVSIGNDTDIGSGHKMTVIDGSTSNDGSYADLVITNMSEHNNARLLLGTPHNTDSTSAFKAAIIADGAGSYSRCDLHFCLDQSTNNTVNADLTDSKMVIKYSTGYVGIGTTNPGYKLDVSGSVRGTSFSGSGYSLTALQAGNISSGTLAVARGGTGQTSYTTGDILYYSGSTLSKLNIGSNGDVLTVSGSTPSWATASGGGSSPWTTSGANIYYNSGNVGIGNNAISGYKLDVTGSVRGTSFAGSGYSLTALQAGNISSGTLAVARGGTGQTSYTTGDILYYSGSTLSKLNIGSNGDVLTVSGSTPSWATASGGGGGGGATAGTVSVSKNSNQIDVTVSGGPYDYMYNQTSYDLFVTSYTFDTLNISTAMTHGQKLVLKLHTSAISNEMQFARGSSLSVNIDGTNHTVFSNFQDHNLHIPYDNNATAVSFLILEITKENTNQVTIEAKLSAANFTKTREFSPSWDFYGITTFNRDSAIHNVAYNSSAAFYGSMFQLRLGYLGVGHSHDFYFTQTDGSSPTFQASQIEFFYNNNGSPWSQASQTNVYTNFDKSVGMTLTYDKEYRIHHEVLQASTDDYPSKILFTVEELNAASGGGGGGGGSYGTGDFDPYITTKQGWQGPWYFYGIEIGSSFSPSNYNFNGTTYNLGSISSFDSINLDHTLPSSLPFEYEFYFYSFNGNISSSFNVRINGSQRTTYNSFPGSGSSNMSCQSHYRYRVLIKPRDSSYNYWSAEWREYRN